MYVCMYFCMYAYTAHECVYILYTFLYLCNHQSLADCWLLDLSESQYAMPFMWRNEYSWLLKQWESWSYWLLDACDIFEYMKCICVLISCRNILCKTQIPVIYRVCARPFITVNCQILSWSRCEFYFTHHCSSDYAIGISLVAIIFIHWTRFQKSN